MSSLLAVFSMITLSRRFILSMNSGERLELEIPRHDLSAPLTKYNKFDNGSTDWPTLHSEVILRKTQLKYAMSLWLVSLLILDACF